VRTWFDTEFHERGAAHPIELISIGMVSEEGGQLYLVSNEFDLAAAEANPWLAENVLPHLPPDSLWVPRDVIAERVVEFCGLYPELWAYYADYDWVVLCQLFGRMIDLPATWPMWCRDVKQLCWSMGDPALPDPLGTEHDALEDAMDCRRKWEYLFSLAVYEEWAE
jgi:hypothetical protein